MREGVTLPFIYCSKLLLFAATAVIIGIKLSPSVSLVLVIRLVCTIRTLVGITNVRVVVALLCHCLAPFKLVTLSSLEQAKILTTDSFIINVDK